MGKLSRVRYSVFGPESDISYLTLNTFWKDNELTGDVIVHCVNTFEEREALIKKMGEGFEHILEYWNRDRNDGAMHDALCHIIEISEGLLTKYKSIIK